jgi:Kdo2-lipid IVA lauroyltransferase/acyltransferase
MARNKRHLTFRQLIYNFRYRCGEYALRGFIGCLPYVPERLVTAFMRLMARITFVFLWKYRQRMEENVATVLGKEIPDRESQKDLVRRAWLNFARGVLDTTTVMHFSKDKIISTVKLEGEEHIRRALEKGNGVIALSAHLGSFTLIGGRLAASGYPFSAVIKHPADERFAKLTDEYRAQIGVQTISAKPRREAVRGILKALRENRIVLVVADEFKSGDAMVDFFDMKMPAPRGPATLALRTGAVTLPMFATRRPDDSIVLTVGAPIVPVVREDLEESVVATTAVYTRHIEAVIRNYPDQWNWLGLPRRDGKMSRAEMARLWRESRKAQAAQNPSGPSKTGASSL